MTAEAKSPRSWISIGIFCLAVTVSAALIFGLSSSANAQSTGSNSLPSIEVAQQLYIEAGKEQILTISVAPENATSGQTMLIIRGLPSSAALTVGRLFESGAWGVRPQDLPNLAILTASNVSGEQPLALSLVTFDGIVLAERNCTLIFVPPGSAVPVTAATQDLRLKHTATDQQALAPPENAAPVLKIPSDAEIDQMLLLMKRGDENMADGKINIARLFYQRAADGGWAAGALALGKTYDAQELARLPVLGGIQPEPELAQKWYATARELGSQEAGQLLLRYGQR